MPSFKIRGLDATYDLFDPARPEPSKAPTSFYVCVPPQAYYYQLITSPTPQWVRAEFDGSSLVWKGLIFGQERVNVLHISPLNFELPPSEGIIEKLERARALMFKSQKIIPKEEFEFNGSDKLNNQKHILKGIASIAIEKPDTADDYKKEEADWEDEWQHGLTLALTTNLRKLDESLPLEMHPDIKNAVKDIHRYLNHENIDKLKLHGSPAHWPTIGEVYDYLIAFITHHVTDKAKLDFNKVLRVSPEFYTITVGKLHASEQLIFTGLTDEQDAIVVRLCADFKIVTENGTNRSNMRLERFKVCPVQELDKFLHLLSSNPITSESDDIILDYFFAMTSAIYTGTDDFDEVYRGYKLDATNFITNRRKNIIRACELSAEGDSNLPDYNEISILRSMTRNQIKSAIEKCSLSAKRLLLLASIMPKDQWDTFLSEVFVTEAIVRDFIDEIVGSLCQSNLDILEISTIKTAINKILLGDGARCLVALIPPTMRPFFYEQFPESFKSINHMELVWSITILDNDKKMRYVLTMSPHYAHLITSGAKLGAIAYTLSYSNQLLFLKSDVVRKSFKAEIISTALKFNLKYQIAYDFDRDIDFVAQLCLDIQDFKKSWLITSGEEFINLRRFCQAFETLPTYLWHKLWEIPGFHEQFLACIQKVSKPINEPLNLLSKEKHLALMKKVPEFLEEHPVRAWIDELSTFVMPIDLDVINHRLLLMLCDDLSVFIRDPSITPENRNVLGARSIDELEGLIKLLNLTESDMRWALIFNDYCKKTNSVNLTREYLEKYKSAILQYLHSRIKQLKSLLEYGDFWWIGTSNEIACFRSYSTADIKVACERGKINTPLLWSAVLSIIPSAEWKSFLNRLGRYDSFGSCVFPVSSGSTLDIFNLIDIDKWDVLLQLPKVMEFLTLALSRANLLIDLSPYDEGSRISLLSITAIKEAVINKMNNDNFLSYLKLFPGGELQFDEDVELCLSEFFFEKNNITKILQILDASLIRYVKHSKVYPQLKDMIMNGQLGTLLENIKADKKLNFLAACKDHLIDITYDDLMMSIKCLPQGHRYLYIYDYAKTAVAKHIKSGFKLFSLFRLLTPKERVWVNAHCERYCIDPNVSDSARCLDIYANLRQFSESDIKKYVAGCLVLSLAAGSKSNFIFDGDDLIDLSQFSLIINESDADILCKFWEMPGVSVKLVKLINSGNNFLQFLSSLSQDKRWPFILSNKHSRGLYENFILHNDADPLFTLLRPIPHDTKTKIDIFNLTRDAFKLKDEKPRQSSAQYLGLNTYQQAPVEDRSFLRELEECLGNQQPSYTIDHGLL